MTRRIDDGHQTLITFSLNPNIKFWEKTVTPPGVDGGGENDTTTMHNEVFRTRAPKKLITMTEGSATVAYDPAVYPEIMAMVNQNQLITIHFADGDELDVWGWLNTFDAGEAEEGSQPTADVGFIVSNQDEDGNEIAPVHRAAA